MNQTHINFLLNSLFWSHTELFDLSFMSLIMMFQQLSTSFPNRIQTTHPHPNLTSSTNLYVSSINGKDHFHPLNPHNSFPLFFHRMFHFLLVMDRKTGMLQSMGSLRVGRDWATELNWTSCQQWLFILNCIVFLHMPNTPVYSSVYYSPKSERKTTEVFPNLIYLFLPNPHFIHHHWYKFKPKVMITQTISSWFLKA